MSLQRHAVQITLLVFLISNTLSTVCYFPDGTGADELPCPDPVGMSCCPVEARCLTNGLCSDSRNILFRGSCRDKNWIDPKCPKFCLEFNRYTGKVFAPCNSVGIFACDYNCTDSNLTIPRGDIALRDYQISSVCSTSFSTLSSLSTSSTVSSIPTHTSTSSTPTSSPLNSISDGNCTENLANCSLTNRSPNRAAIAAGVSLGLAWLATLVFFGRERRKTRLLELEKSQWRGAAQDYQHFNGSENPDRFKGGIADLVENRALREMAAEPLAHELQT